MANGYYLISKIERLPYCKYKGDALRLINQSAMVVDEVVVGNKKNQHILRKITTFRNSQGEIIERAINFSDKPYKNRIYLKRDNVIGENEFVTSTHIKEYTLPRSLKKTFLEMLKTNQKRTLLWTPIKFFTNHFSENIETGEKVLTQVKQSNLLKPQKETHSFTEFPHIKNGKISSHTKKILKFTVNTLNSHKINKNNITEQFAKIPENDSFLGLRALDIEDSKTAFTQKFITERGLKNKRITINPSYVAENREEELTKAMFDPNDGTVNFVIGHNYKSKSEVCTTARHETEHGWQFYLHARNTKGEATDWEEKIYELFRDLPNKLKKEAQEYTDSIKNYVTVAENKEKYRKNFIEIKANKAGINAGIRYNRERTEIQKEFPHIPSELL